MLKFNPLKVREIQTQGEDAVEIVFDVPEALKGDYQFIPGQHLAIKHSADGKDIRRTYSICTGPNSGKLCIGVRRVEGGAFSSFANDDLKVGDTLEVMTPSGRFQTALSADQSKTYAAFAAGSGITPILSIITAILETEPESKVALFYGNRRVASMMFREALMDLKNRYMDRFSVQFVLSREHTEIPICNGRIDKERALQLLEAFCTRGELDDVFVCGPDTMIDEVQAAAQSFGIESDRIHFERFGNPLKKKDAPAAKPGPAPTGKQTQVSIVMDAHHKEFDMPQSGVSVLDAARDAGLELPFSCKAGVCSTCRAKLTDGEVNMAANYSLEPWELEAGYVLTCQCTPKTDSITLDYDS